MSETSVSNYQSTWRLYPEHLTVLLEGQVCYEYVMCLGDVDIRILWNVGIPLPGCTPSRMYSTRQHSWKSKPSDTLRCFNYKSKELQRTWRRRKQGRAKRLWLYQPKSRRVWEDWNFHEHPCESLHSQRQIRSCSFAQLITTPWWLVWKWKCINKHCDEGSASHLGCLLLGKNSDTQRLEGGVRCRFGLRADDTASRRTLQHVALSATCSWTNERSQSATLFSTHWTFYSCSPLFNTRSTENV